MGDVPISESSSRRPRPSVSVAVLVERWESSVSRTPPALLPRARARAPAPPKSSPASCPDSSSVAGNVTVDNFSAFDCSICYLPLKPPIFQCTVGHVVCSACHDKLKLRRKATECHVCRAPTRGGGGYSRCHAMEHAVDSIRLPCPHAARGCAKRPAYHDHEAHARTCAYKPCE